jgi:hypothetical protein
VYGGAGYVVDSGIERHWCNLRLARLASRPKKALDIPYGPQAELLVDLDEQCVAVVLDPLDVLVVRASKISGTATIMPKNSHTPYPQASP